MFGKLTAERLTAFFTAMIAVTGVDWGMNLNCPEEWNLLTPFSRKFGAIVFLLLWSCGHASPQARHTVEVTRADFTKEAKIVSTELAIFGVMLGDSISDARAKIEHAGLKLTAPEGRHTIIANDGTELVGTRVDGDKIVMLALFSAMAKYLAGDSVRLLSDDVTSPDSPVRLHLLGREDKRDVEHNSIGSIVTCSYDKEGIRLIRSYSRYGDAPTVMHFVPPARTR